MQNLRPQRERCKRLSADTSRKTIEVLNAYFAGEFSIAAGLSQEVRKCKSCHTKGSEMSNSRGKMSCGSCHFSLAKVHA